MQKTMEFVKIPLQLKSKFNKVTRYKINMEYSITFYTQLQTIEVKIIMLHIMKTMKNLGINLTKDM